MNNIKNVFSIKDLENFSGIKSHTIRMWEKRYGLLEPERTDTNIRYYSTESLQKLLNVTLLNRHGYKISKIATVPEEQIPELVREITSVKNAPVHAINAFKIAMMNFDQALFFETYDELLAEKPLHEVFYDVVIPFLEHIGFLWQTGSITPAHEHFISYLIRQKLLILSEREQRKSPVTDRTFVLFLPQGELHELGLMYIHYEVLRNGHRSVYLGEDVPLENLRDVEQYFDNLTLISSFTVAPTADQAQAYVQKVVDKFTKPVDFWAIGKNIRDVKKDNLGERVRLFDSIKELCQEL
jgi:DNA-binding transcriptional MerR regulator